MRAADLLIWHPRVERAADPRQGELFNHADGGSLPAEVVPEWIARAGDAELAARQSWGLHRLMRWALGRGW